MPLLRREHGLGLHAQCIVEPALGKMNLEQSRLEMHAVALGVRREGGIRRLLDHSREDGAAVCAARLNPPRQGELVEEAEVSDIAAVDEAPAVERRAASGREGLIAVFKFR